MASVYELSRAQQELSADTYVNNMGEDAPFDFYETYRDSRFGMHHAEQAPRFYQKYGYDQAQMLLDLGADVHPVGHMKYTHDEIALPLLSAQLASSTARAFSTLDVRALRVAALTHDIGECEGSEILEKMGFTVGDVAKMEKNGDHEDQEALIRDYLYRQLYSDVPELLLEKAEAITMNRDNDFATYAFNSCENLGYYQTALRAGELAIFSTLPPDNRTTQLGSLAVDVSGRWRPVLERAANDFPYIERVMEETAPEYFLIQGKLAA